MSESHPSGLMIDLDSLFDTRLGTLVLHFFDEAQHTLISNKYHNRLDDSFNNTIDKVKFKECYDKRDANTLANSTLSLMNDIIRDFIKNTLTSDPSAPHSFYPVIYINTYPYILSEDERENIRLGVHLYFNEKAIVELVHMDYKALTVEYVSTNLTVLILYEYNKWLDAQTEINGFKEHACPDVTLFGPRVFFKELPKTATEADKAFMVLTNIAKPFINLELLPSLFFSTYLAPGKHTKPKEATNDTPEA